MNFTSTQGYVDGPTVIDQIVATMNIGEGYRSHRIYAALTGQAGDWCECDVIFRNKRGEAGRLPLKMFKPVAQGYFPSDSAFAASATPPAAPNVVTVQMNYSGDLLYLFPTYVADEITRVTLVPRGLSVAMTQINFYLGVFSER